MSSQVEENLPFDLEHYLSRLSLQPIIPSSEAPPLPPIGKRSTMAPLTLKPEGFRKLREMHRFDMGKNVVKYFKKLTSVDGAAVQGLDLPMARQNTDDSEFNPYIAHGAGNVVNILYRFLLNSTQKVLETLDESMREWTFQTALRPRSDASESQSLDPILFCRPGSPTRPTSVQVVILSLGPWEFSPQDFHEFTSPQRFDDTLSKDWTNRKWINADRMWAYLYDLCLDCECPYFVVTSYDQWVFGQFSKHYTNAWFSPTLRYDNNSVSILEMLIYWIHASLGKPGTLPPPPVYIERKLTTEYLEKERQSHAKRFLHDGFSGTGPELHTEDLPAAKRQRRTPEDEFASSCGGSQARAAAPERFKELPKLFKQLRAYRKKKRAKRRLTLWKDRASESVILQAPSVAPSSADPLPQNMVPVRKNAMCERWRDLVAKGDDGLKLKDLWVDVTLQVYNPATGSVTGDFVVAPDRTCSSCCPPSPTMSACSLTEEEIARWTPKPVDNLSNCPILYQWF